MLLIVRANHYKIVMIGKIFFLGLWSRALSVATPSVADVDAVGYNLFGKESVTVVARLTSL
jgi:hypothetical protein